MAIKLPKKIEDSLQNVEAEAWIKKGKDADDKIIDKVPRKQISVYLDVIKIQEVKKFCVNHDIRFNDFYEKAILNQLEIEKTKTL